MKLIFADSLASYRVKPKVVDGLADTFPRRFPVRAKWPSQNQVLRPGHLDLQTRFGWRFLRSVYPHSPHCRLGPNSSAANWHGTQSCICVRIESPFWGRPPFGFRGVDVTWPCLWAAGSASGRGRPSLAGAGVPRFCHCAQGLEEKQRSQHGCGSKSNSWGYAGFGLFTRVPLWTPIKPGVC